MKNIVINNNCHCENGVLLKCNVHLKKGGFKFQNHFLKMFMTR